MNRVHNVRMRSTSFVGVVLLAVVGSACNDQDLGALPPMISVSPGELVFDLTPGSREIAGSAVNVASKLALARFAYKLHRELVAWGTMGEKGLCGKYLMPVMRKQQYRFQATNPNPQISGRYACAPIGASTTFMSKDQVYPAIGEDMGYLVWRKRNCCAL